MTFDIFIQQGWLMNHRKLKLAMDLCVDAHANHAKKENVRSWDEKTPYFVHPLWCAMTLMQETSPKVQEGKEDYFFALLFHDLIEDTTVVLPDWLSSESVSLIRQMTFFGEVGSTEIEKREIWSRPPIVRLLKLYDKVSNLLDGLWMSDEKWNGQYAPYVLHLANDAETNFGDLNIVRIARAVAITRSVSKTTRA